MQLNGHRSAHGTPISLLTSRRVVRPVPAVIVSVGVPRAVPLASRLFEVMLDIGWTLAAAPVPLSAFLDGAVVAELAIDSLGMRLLTYTEVNGRLLTADDAPELPAGWREAADSAGGHCAVIVVDVIDLAHRRKLSRYIDSAARRKAVLIGRAVVTTGL